MMVKIFEMQQQTDNIANHQSRIIEFESFEEYLQNVNERSLPSDNEIINKKIVNFKDQTVTFHFLYSLHNKVCEFVHFAKVIG